MDRTLKSNKHLENNNLLDSTLSHFLPLKNWIKKDQTLIADCFEKILGLPKGSIQIKSIAPIEKEIAGKNIEEWKIEVDTIIAGKIQSQKAAVAITIHLNETDNLLEYVAGGQKRKLLEEVLYPNFIGKNIDCITQLKYQSTDQLFYLKDKGNSGRIGVSTVL